MRVEGQLGQGRLDSRVRAAIEGPMPNKTRHDRVQGVLKTITKEWCIRQRRQRNPAMAGPRGAQGPVPKRGSRGPPGPLVQRMAPPPLAGVAPGEVGVEVAEEDVDMAALL